MSQCTRFEQEGILQLESGQPLDPHFSECADCQQAYAKYQTLQQMLVELHQDQQPESGWQEAVLAQTPPARPSKPRWLVPATLAAGFLGAAVLVNVIKQPEQRLNLQLAIRDSGQTYRSGNAKPGDQLLITTTGIRQAYAEFRLYDDNNQLLLSCQDKPPCQRDRGTLTATVTLEQVGSYRSVVLASKTKPPPAGEGLDADVSQARSAGAAVVVSDPVTVR